ncbi:signal peptidase II [Mycobacterium sp. DSM 3803]|nr:signal peptidase II [Mycobacterium sp. DSM 3803]
MTSMPAAAAIIGAAPTRRRLLFVVGAAVLLVDVGTKSLAVGLLEPGHAVSLVGDRLVCVLTRNAGAALSMAAGNAVLLSVAVLVTVMAVGALGWRVRSVGWALGLGMVLGGATGNLVDRVFRSPGPLRGQVVDFLAIGWGPVFNVADFAVLGGVICLITLSLIGSPLGSANQKTRSSAG